MNSDPLTGSPPIPTAEIVQFRDCQLVNSLVSQCPGTGNDTYVTWRMDVTRHDTDFALAWCNYTRAVWSDKNGIFTFEVTLNAYHVQNRNTFRDTDNQFKLSFDGFDDGFCSKCRGT